MVSTGKDTLSPLLGLISKSEPECSDSLPSFDATDPRVVGGVGLDFTGVL